MPGSRIKDPEGERRRQAYGRALQRALRALRRSHDAEFRKLLSAEMRREGYDE